MAWTDLIFTIGQILTAGETNQLQDNIRRVRISDKGPTAPALPAAGAQWLDDAQAIWQQKIYDGAAWLPALFVDPAQDEAGPTGGGAGHWGDYLASDVTGERTEFSGLPYVPKNMLLNADMRYWQRGNSFHVTGAEQYVADRWMTRVRSSGVAAQPRVLVTQSSDRPTGLGVYSSLELRVVSVRAATQSGDLLQIEQMVEGTVARRALFGSTNARYTRLSFYLWANVTGRVSLNIANNSRNVSWTVPIDISVASSWAYYNLGFLRPTSGSWDYADDVGIRVGLTLAGGAEYRCNTPAAWVYNSPDVRVASGQLNGMATVGTTFRFTGMQYELGELATPLELLDSSLALTMLQRYYWKTFEIDQRPLVNTGIFEGALTCTADSAGYANATVKLASPMVRIPYVQTVCLFAANTKWWRQTAGAVGADGSAISTSKSQLWISSAVGNSLWAGQQMVIHASADAEFYTD